jgi:hypothetical protein
LHEDNRDAYECHVKSLQELWPKDYPKHQPKTCPKCSKAPKACECGDAPDPDLSTEEQATYEVIRSARQVQEFLWGDINTGCGLEEFRRMLRKRLSKIDGITQKNHYWRVEMRKRLLQLAAISINVIGKLDGGHDFTSSDIVSNLPQHAEPIKCEEDQARTAIEQAEVE